MNPDEVPDESIEQPEVTEQPAEQAVEPDEPKSLDDLLEDWNRVEKPEVDPDESSTEALPDFDPDDLETWNQLHSISTALDAENSELLQEVQALRDQRAAETDKRELAAAVAKVTDLSETDVPANLIESAILIEFVKNELFREAYDNRAENPGEWESQLIIFASDLPKAKQERDDRGLAAAAHMARNINSLGASRFDSLNWGRLSPQEFEQKKQEVFEAARSGELRPESRGGAFFRTV